MSQNGGKPREATPSKQPEVVMKQAEVVDMRRTGYVVWFNRQKGFGVIKTDREGKDLFVLRSAIKSNRSKGLRIAEKVVCMIGVGKDGKDMAVDVTRWFECYTCGLEGHISRDCPQEKKRAGGGGGGVCYNCQRTGHIARNCTNTSRPRGAGNSNGNCFNCNEPGHIARHCTRPRSKEGGSNDITCYNCNGVGHIARNCQKQRSSSDGEVSCYNCGEAGHYARECTVEPNH